MAKVAGGDAFEADEINMHIENLIAAWGKVVIECDSYGCLVSDKDAYARTHSECLEFEASALLDALRKAAA